MRLHIFLFIFFLLLFSGCGNDKGQAPSDIPEQIKKLAPKQLRHCLPCHTLKKGEKAKIGPNLFGILGKRVGQAEGFRYSKSFGEGQWTWTRENLKLIISRETGAATDAVKILSGNPSAKTNMKFYGADGTDAEIILDYLETLKD